MLLSIIETRIAPSNIYRVPSVGHSLSLSLSLSQSQSLINMTRQQWSSGDEPGSSISDQGWWGGKFWLEIRLTKLETINKIKSGKPQISELRRAHCSILCWEDRENGAVSTADDGWVFIFSFIFLTNILRDWDTEIKQTKSNESENQQDDKI